MHSQTIRNKLAIQAPAAHQRGKAAVAIATLTMSAVEVAVAAGGWVGLREGPERVAAEAALARCAVSTALSSNWPSIWFGC